MNVRLAAAIAALILGAAPLAAQSAAEHIALGDREHAAMNAAGALAHYEAAVKADPKYDEALWKASRDAVDLGEFNADEVQREAYFAEGEKYARRAVAANPNDAEGHFVLARALGRVALTLGVKQRVNYAKEIRMQALEALKYDSLHPGALHVMGRWNAEIMRLSGFSRFVARRFLGAGVFKYASWEEAIDNLERAAELDPGRIYHHLDLAEVYLDRKRDAEARAELEKVAGLPERDVLDPVYKARAAALLARLEQAGDKS